MNECSITSLLKRSYGTLVRYLQYVYLVTALKMHIYNGRERNVRGLFKKYGFYVTVSSVPLTLESIGFSVFRTFSISKYYFIL